MKKQIKKVVRKSTNTSTKVGTKKIAKVVNIFAKKALSVVCKKCKAKVGKPCVHTILHKGKPRTNPHRVRITAVVKSTKKAA